MRKRFMVKSSESPKWGWRETRAQVALLEFRIELHVGVPVDGNATLTRNHEPDHAGSSGKLADRLKAPPEDR